MNLFGLEGSGFLIAVCLTLFLSGMIVFYVRQKFNETDHKIQHMLGIVQQINANNLSMPQEVQMGGGRGSNPPNVNETYNNDGVTGVMQNDIDASLLTHMPPIPEGNEHQRISVSESSELSSTTDEDDDDENSEDDHENTINNDDADENMVEHEGNNEESGVEILDADELENDTKIIDEIPAGNKVINIENMDEIKLEDFADLPADENTSDSDENELKIGGENLDSMLMGMLDSIGKKNDEFKSGDDNIHVVELDNLASNNKIQQEFNDLKVSELRQLIKDKGMKVNNLSKLKKNECIELLS
jgi:hypothetical protein